jgi:hypothetical protein
MASLHGLVRGENMELGRDSDTGGQVLWGTTFSKNEKRSDNATDFPPLFLIS